MRWIPALIALALSAAACRNNPNVPTGRAAVAFDLEEATIADLQRRMELGQDTARTIVDKYLARIDAIDRQGPTLRSVIEINPEARSDANRLDAERKTRG